MARDRIDQLPNDLLVEILQLAGNTRSNDLPNTPEPCGLEYMVCSNSLHGTSPDPSGQCPHCKNFGRLRPSTGFRRVMAVNRTWRYGILEKLRKTSHLQRIHMAIWDCSWHDPSNFSWPLPPEAVYPALLIDTRFIIEGVMCSHPHDPPVHLSSHVKAHFKNDPWSTIEKNCFASVEVAIPRGPGMNFGANQVVKQSVEKFTGRAATKLTIFFKHDEVGRARYPACDSLAATAPSPNGLRGFKMCQDLSVLTHKPGWTQGLVGNCVFVFKREASKDKKGKEPKKGKGRIKVKGRD